MKDYDKEIDQLVESLDVSEKDKELMRASIYQNLKIRLGIKLAAELDEGQLKELEDTYADEDHKTAFAKIEQLVPDVDQMLSQELKEISGQLGLS